MRFTWLDRAESSHVGGGGIDEIADRLMGLVQHSADILPLEEDH